MIIIFATICLIVILYYFIYVFKYMYIYGFNYIPTDKFLSGLDAKMPLWQHSILSFIGICTCI